MTKEDKIKRSALDRIDMYIKSQINKGRLLENIELNQELCCLSAEEYNEVKTNIEEFNNDLNRRYIYCKNRSITVQNKENAYCPKRKTESQAAHCNALPKENDD